METLNIGLTVASETVREAQKLTGARSQHEALQRVLEAGIHTLRHEAGLKPRLAAVRRVRRALKGATKRITSARELQRVVGV